MCIIVYKPDKVAMPSEDILRLCWQHNSDGAGFSFIRDGLVHGRKGFMKLKDMLEALKNEAQHYQDGALLMHFRIATHGLKDASATHPFPVSCVEEHLTWRNYSAQVVVAHNGIVTGFGDFVGGLSDTQHFIKDILSKPTIKDNLHDETFGKLIAQASTSKWCVMSKDGRVTTIGDWEESKGVLYSNDGYLERSFSTVYAGTGYTELEGEEHWKRAWSRYEQRQGDCSSLDKQADDLLDGVCPACQRDLEMDQAWNCPHCAICLSCLTDPCVCELGNEDNPDLPSDDETESLADAGRPCGTMTARINGVRNEYCMESHTGYYLNSKGAKCLVCDRLKWENVGPDSPLTLFNGD